MKPFATGAEEVVGGADGMEKEADATAGVVGDVGVEVARTGAKAVEADPEELG